MDLHSYSDILRRVEQPAQYIGGEWNAVVKDHDAVDLTVALAFPDTYTIGMSHAGLPILYAVLNRRDDVAAERVFMPLPDMQAALREAGVPLVSLETRTPLRAFDVLGFSLQYEMCYTNVLAMLDLAGIPIRSVERERDAPLVVAGGVGAMAPEPLAPFIDVFVVGDGEDAVLALADAALATRGMPRAERLRAMADASPCFYVPALYREQRDAEGALVGLEPIADGVPRVVRRALVEDLEQACWPTAPVVPHVEAVHDRMVGAKGAWKETVQGIKNAVDADVYLMTNTTLTDLNTADIEETVAFIAKLGVPTFACNGLIYAGKGRDVGIGIPEKDLGPILDKIQAAVRAHSLRLIWYTPTRYCEFNPLEKDLGVKGCTAARYNMCVEPNGDVIPCQSYYQAMGNILTDPWESIWHNRVAENLRNRTWLPAECKECADVAICGGGCPLYAEEGEYLCVESQSTAP